MFKTLRSTFGFKLVTDRSSETPNRAGIFQFKGNQMHKRLLQPKITSQVATTGNSTEMCPTTTHGLQANRGIGLDRLKGIYGGSDGAITPDL